MIAHFDLLNSALNFSLSALARSQQPDAATLRRDTVGERDSADRETELGGARRMDLGLGRPQEVPVDLELDLARDVGAAQAQR